MSFTLCGPSFGWVTTKWPWTRPKVLCDDQWVQIWRQNEKNSSLDVTLRWRITTRSFRGTRVVRVHLQAGPVQQTSCTCTRFTMLHFNKPKLTHNFPYFVIINYNCVHINVTVIMTCNRHTVVLFPHAQLRVLTHWHYKRNTQHSPRPETLHKHKQ